MLRSSAVGFGYLALSALLAEEAAAAEPPSGGDGQIGNPSYAAAGPLAPRRPHFAARARRVIFLFMTGGVSHLESFDPKPALARAAGQKPRGRTLLAPQFEFHPAGSCGTPVSELFPHIASCADDICVIRSLTGSHFEHFQATLGVHTGSLTVKRPSIGS